MLNNKVEKSLMKPLQTTLAVQTGSADVNYCLKVGNMVFYSYRATNTNATNTFPAAIFPEGYRPKSNVSNVGTVFVNSAWYPAAPFRIDTNGRLVQILTSDVCSIVSISGFFTTD